MENLIQLLIEAGYTTKDNINFERSWGKSGADMDYVHLDVLTYTREYADPTEDNWTVCCDNLTELEDYALDVD